ncbi:hypothetical protein [Amycolatopsis sacchari]|uniref:hypothetical protein n=1 Tax=Amycolatopsis sacchari TaxID=115433 RepID=UPI003D737252
MPGQRLRPTRPAPPLFAEFSPLRKVLTVVGAPLLFGVIAAFTLVWWLPAWWTWQGIGILGAVVGGYEHLRLGPAALRGAAGGLVAAAAVVGLRAVLPGEDVTDFDPVSFPVTAVIASVILHSGGALLRRRRRDARPVPAE